MVVVSWRPSPSRGVATSRMLRLDELGQIGDSQKRDSSFLRKFVAVNT
jgi:hypothetical protein